MEKKGVERRENVGGKGDAGVKRLEEERDSNEEKKGSTAAQRGERELDININGAIEMEADINTHVDPPDDCRLKTEGFRNNNCATHPPSSFYFSPPPPEPFMRLAFKKRRQRAKESGRQQMRMQ
ncbi:unnamed protein product [Pleuronectes platessa]|uniref:Uncharacterized protein n=1 Tax=Pleuronectes platessa TaxID=8262 RepID=A0A9N7ZDQ5_PLEPL|nr:unnamed protein product [Pleuronectes platessa]